MAGCARTLPSAFIFDCDGTLLRSMGMWLQIEVDLLASYGIKTTPDDFAQFESLSMMGECCAYHDTWGVGSSGQEVYDKLMAMLMERYRTQVSARPGVASFLEAVRAAGIPMAIATSTPEPAVRCGLSANGLDDYFDVIVTTGEAGASKDHPDVYNLALERLCAARGIEIPARDRVWVFEDAVFGLRSSGAAGYRRVGIFDAEGRSARSDVQANCEIFIDEFTELSLADVCSWSAEKTETAVRRVALIGGSPEPSGSDTIRRAVGGCDAVVAIDRGLDAVCAAGIDADLFCGDVDSVSAAGAALVHKAESCGDAPFSVERYDPHKDFTDLSLVLRATGERWGAPALVCTCLAGGNPDHLLGVFGRLAAWPGPVELVEDGFEGRVLHAGESWAIEGARAHRFSFIPLSEQATVSEHGMRWELDHHEAELLSDLGISNVIEHDPATITCHAGTLICWCFNR